MIAAPGSPGVPSLRSPRPAESAAMQAVWEASHVADDPGGRPRGGWSVDTWATQLRVLTSGERIVGIAAIRAEPPAVAVSARVALGVAERTAEYAERLVQATIDMARGAGGAVVRLFMPSRAEWATSAASTAGFTPVRSIFHMLLPATVTYAESNADPAGVRIRQMREGEEPHVLAALNRNWAGTWDFVPIRPELLAGDLHGQRAGMLVAVDAADDAHILATCHAVFDPADQNPDGAPKAWISNLTVDPEHRGRGLGRAMLLAGLRSLRERGAGSITLGVDAGNAQPLRLYQSIGFETVSSLDAWDKSLHA